MSFNPYPSMILTKVIEKDACYFSHPTKAKVTLSSAARLTEVLADESSAGGIDQLLP